MAGRDLEHVEGAIACDLLGAIDAFELGERDFRLLGVDVARSFEEEQREDVVLLVRDLVPKQVSG